jgi:ComF family protein
MPIGGEEALCVRCRESPPHFSMARSAGIYEGSLRQIIHAFKYGKRRALATPLARLMAAAGHDVLDGAEAVIPVPLDPWRALKRGFNQADDLASFLGLPVWRVLRRRPGGRPQTGLPAARRRANVTGEFARPRRQQLASLVRCRDRRLSNRTVVLVDDVMTTGATLDACAAVLFDAGVRTVRALTVARAVTTPRGSLPEPPHLSIAPRR